MRSRRIAALPALALSLLCFAPDARALPIVDLSLKENPLLSPAFLTRNTVRRSPRSEDESSAILKVGMGCTGFFVANRQDRLIIGTARHCVRYEITERCKARSLNVTTANGKHEGYCKGVVAASVKDDLALIEVEFPDAGEELRNEISFLKLAAYVPRPWNRFKMIGYPADHVRKGALTVAENCWDNTAFGTDWMTGEKNAEGPRGPTDYHGYPGATGGPEGMLRPLHLYHNCSTYGGNSGGPIILEDTDEVVGIPDSYDSKRVVHGPRESAAYEASAGFVNRNRRALRNAGVIIADQPGADYNTHWNRTDRALNRLDGASQ